MPQSIQPGRPERTRASHDSLRGEQHAASYSRRAALKGLFAVAASAVLFGLPSPVRAATASKETTDALAKAQQQLDQLQKQIDSISDQVQSISEQQDKTIGKIEDVQKQIDATQKQIEKKQKELDKKRSALSSRVATNYKSGDQDLLTLLLSSESFEDLISKSYYVGKVNQHDRDAIQEVKTVQEQLNGQKAELEKQKKELEQLKEQQTAQLKEMKAKKDEVQKLLDGASKEVKDLMAKRDAELLANAKAEEAARKALSQPQGGGSTGGGTTYIPGAGQGSAGAGNRQQRVVAACHRTPSPGIGLCAAWVTNVFVNAGLGHYGGNADDMYSSWCVSSSKSNLQVGMIIAVSSHPHTAAGRIYGHVGIYVGDNTVMDNIGSIRTINVDSWISFYGATVTPRWGWLGGNSLA